MTSYTLVRLRLAPLKNGCSNGRIMPGSTGRSSTRAPPALQLQAVVSRSQLESEIHELNGQPALVFYDGDAPFAALLLGVADSHIHRVYFHADPARLHHLGPRNPTP